MHVSLLNMVLLSNSPNQMQAYVNFIASLFGAFIVLFTMILGFVLWWRAHRPQRVRRAQVLISLPGTALNLFGASTLVSAELGLFLMVMLGTRLVVFVQQHRMLMQARSYPRHPSAPRIYKVVPAAREQSHVSRAYRLSPSGKANGATS